MKRDVLIGAWRLTTLYGESASGEVDYPFGEAPRGLLCYLPNGYMSLVIVQADRAPFPGDDLRSGTDAQVRAAFESFDASCGRYTLDAARGAVIHHLEASRIPNWSGREQARYVALDGDRLHLHTDPIRSGGEAWIMHAIWQRLP